ncbi:TPA: hypothetical protein RQK93_004708 [Vibrio vulnificus]|nr:hypothetical protein [Vibrio vulnificus]
MSESVIFADFANNDLVEFKYNIDPWDSMLNSIELVTHDRSGMFKSFKFEGVSNLEIEKVWAVAVSCTFCGGISCFFASKEKALVKKSASNVISQMDLIETRYKDA